MSGNRFESMQAIQGITIQYDLHHTSCTCVALSMACCCALQTMLLHCHGIHRPLVMTVCVVIESILYATEIHIHVTLVFVKGKMILCDVHIVRDTP